MSAATKTRVKQVKIRNLDTKIEHVEPQYATCGSCGMGTKHPREFHPFAACLMFEACHDADKVRANLAFVIRCAEARFR